MLTGAAATTVAMAVLMLPSALPLLRLDRATSRSSVHVAGVAAGYAAVWAAIGAATMPLAMLPLGRRAAAAALAAAALYQVSPLERRCLARCRAPLARIVHGWRDGVAGAARMGVENGVWCAGCCAGLLAALVVLGATGLAGMLVFGAVVAFEKTAARGVAASRAVAAALAVAAVVWAA